MLWIFWCGCLAVGSCASTVPDMARRELWDAMVMVMAMAPLSCSSSSCALFSVPSSRSCYGAGAATSTFSRCYNGCRTWRRMQGFALRTSALSPTTAMDEATVVELPCLPFTPAEVLVPSSTKTLHLYEARFLALLEEALRKCNNLFVHVVIERTGRRDNEYAVKYGCLSHIQSVRRLEIGALITIRGIGRVSMISLSQMEPFLKGVVVPLKDEVPKDMNVVFSSVDNLKNTLADVQQLQIKLKTPKHETLQTPLENALEWALKANFAEDLNYFIPNREERLSFAALQPISGATAGELHKLLQQRLVAMESTDTLQRLSDSIKYAEESRSSVAAKVAIQSLEL